MKTGSLIFLLGCLLAILSCNKEEHYDPIPRIFDGSYELRKNQSGRDTAILIKFAFTDGDANVGVTEADSFPPYDKNLMISYFQKENGQFVKILIPGTQDTLNFNSRINKVNSSNLAKGLVETTVNLQVVFADTIRFDYYIVDRLRNKSNMISTGEIVLTK